MNEHERDRIAAAFNQLRPDWPTKSLRTLLDRTELAHRPRRDVVVALGWVACEPNTHTPARVLEAGPWWRAAAVDGTGAAPRHTKPSDACTHCGQVLVLDPACCNYPTRKRGRGARRPADLTTTIPVRGAEQDTTEEDA